MGRWGDGEMVSHCALAVSLVDGVGSRPIKLANPEGFPDSQASGATRRGRQGHKGTRAQGGGERGRTYYTFDL